MTKIETNIEKLVADTINTLVTTLSGSIETRVQEMFRAKVKEVFGAEVAPAQRVVNATRKVGQRPQCPVPGCHELGAPKYHQVCVKHGREFKAMTEGGDRM